MSNEIRGFLKFFFSVHLTKHTVRKVPGLTSSKLIIFFQQYTQHVMKLESNFRALLSERKNN